MFGTKGFSSGIEVCSNSGCTPDKLCLLVVKNDQIPKKKKREKLEGRKNMVINQEKKKQIWNQANKMGLLSILCYAIPLQEPSSTALSLSLFLPLSACACIYMFLTLGMHSFWAYCYELDCWKSFNAGKKGGGEHGGDWFLHPLPPATDRAQNTPAISFVSYKILQLIDEVGLGDTQTVVKERQNLTACVIRSS